jgi:hypothetical protein
MSRPEDIKDWAFVVAFYLWLIASVYVIFF